MKNLLSDNLNGNGKKRIRVHNNSHKNKKQSWILILVFTTIILSITISSVSSAIVQKINLFGSMIVLLSIILIGVFFDIVGIAVAVADETPFHAMASSKVRGAKNAIKLVRNASKVATFCNDVVGDVCGVVSGSASAFIVLKLSYMFAGIDVAILGIIISALVAAITVFGKGLGKTFAISKSNQIVYRVALLQYYTLNKLNAKKNIFKEIGKKS